MTETDPTKIEVGIEPWLQNPPTGEMPKEKPPAKKVSRWGCLSLGIVAIGLVFCPRLRRTDEKRD